MQNIFSYTYLPLVNRFCCSGLLPIFKIGLLFSLLLSFKRSLYMLDNNVSHLLDSDVSFANTLFQSVTSPIILFTFLSQSRIFKKTLIKSRLSVIYFMNHTSGVVYKNSHPYPGSSRVIQLYSLLPSRNFIVLCFTFRSIITLT